MLERVNEFDDRPFDGRLALFLGVDDNDYNFLRCLGGYRM